MSLLFGTSIYDLKQPKAFITSDIMARDGLRLCTPATALARVGEGFYTRHPVEAQIVLNSIEDPSDILRCLLEEGRSYVSGRIVGAFRHIGRADIAAEIAATMKAAGYDVREKNPFTIAPISSSRRAADAPIVLRIEGFWHSMRKAIIDAFPKPPGLPGNSDAYLRSVDDIYQSDAYHSLSIEGYRVTPALIQRVRSGDWNPDGDWTERHLAH